MEEKILEKYSVVADNVTGEVEIKRVAEELVPIYNLKLPEIGKGTEALINKIREKLIVEIPVKTTELLDITAIESLKKRFETKGLEMIKKELPKVKEETAKYLVGLLIHEMLGLGILEMPLADPNLEEIVINTSTEPAWVYHKKFGWLKTNIRILNEADILNFASIIGRRVGRQITILNPLMDAHLTTGDRVNATLFPISTKGNTLTIRKFRRAPWTITDFIKNKTISPEVASWVWLAIQYELNMIVAGGTASGKTSLLNVFMAFIPPNHRVVSIEDSVSGKEEIIVKVDDKIKRKKIEDFFMENEKESDCIYPENLEVLSMDKKGRIEFKKVLKIFRHYVKKPLYEISLASGRKIKVTGDHSLFSLSQNLKIEPVKVCELKVGDRIATPRKIVLSEEIRELDLSEYLNIPGAFVTGESLKKFLESKEGREFLIKQIPTQLRCRRRFYRKKGILPLKLFKILKKEKKIKFNDLIIFKSHGKSKLPLILKLDEDVCFFFGCWIGDGSYDKRSVIISMFDQESMDRFKKLCEKYGFSLKKHSDGYSLMINSSLLKNVMVAIGFVGDSFSKRIPEFIFSIPRRLKGEFLKGIFSAEGWVRKHEVAISSYSKDLMKDIQALLLDFGILLRIKEYKDKLGKIYCQGNISNIKFLQIFSIEIGFAQGYKRRNLESLLSRNIKDVSDVIPLPKYVYRELKYIFRDNLPISYFSWKSWHGAYRNSHIGREYFRKLVLSNSKKSENITNPIDGKALIDLATNDIFWDEIVEIRKEEYEGYVYDLSVEENENFVCNNIIAHNTRELQLPNFLHWVPLTTREPNPEGRGGVEMLDLLVNSLRMRPDRIIVGEIRRAREAEVLFEAMHTGHSVYATVHADTAEQTYKRLVNPPISVPEIMLESLHLIAVCFRDRRLGIRRIWELAEIVPAGEAGKVGARINVLYRWKPIKDVIEKENESVRLIEELRMHTGMSEKEIQEDLREKQKILNWFVKYNVNKVNAIGRVVSEYYINREEVLKAIEQDIKPEKLIPPEFLKD
jgi:type IV secretory pathway ATPase VirB11/archaellum biosynthesis ATPase/intein/homing endonuclease